MLDRRDFIRNCAGTFGGMALAMMLHEETRATWGDGTLVQPHHLPRAKRVVQLFMAGAASHIDLFDHKPRLDTLHGQASDFGEHVEAFQNGLGPWMKSPFRFSPHGGCGKMLSEVVELSLIHI